MKRVWDLRIGKWFATEGNEANATAEAETAPAKARSALAPEILSGSSVENAYGNYFGVQGSIEADILRLRYRFSPL